VPVALFAAHPDIAESYRRRYGWILVDEYQDINAAQYELIRLLAPTATSNLCVIGDPNQGIYGFRGADIRFNRRPQPRDLRLSRGRHQIYRAVRIRLSGSRAIPAAQELPLLPDHTGRRPPGHLRRRRSCYGRNRSPGGAARRPGQRYSSRRDGESDRAQ
jgi:hypothetical protein